MRDNRRRGGEKARSPPPKKEGNAPNGTKKKEMASAPKDKKAKINRSKRK